MASIPSTGLEKLRIGILLTHPKQERKKKELLECTTAGQRDCPWKSSVPKQFVFPRRDGVKLPLGKCGVPTDVAIGACINHFSQADGVEVDFIQPHEVNPARLQRNDLNFLLIYDLLEAFHTDKTDRKVLYNSLKTSLAKVDNIFPPLKYQELIYSKINYYNYMKDNDIAILPTLTMTAEEYRQLGPDNAAERVLEHVKNESWKKCIAKPVYGQESKDINFFEAGEEEDLQDYFRTCMDEKKYPGIVFQKAIKHFGNNTKCPELRLYFSGDQYKYTVCADNSEKIRTPVSEGGRLKQLPMARLKRECQGILKKLPPIVMPNGAQLPRLITRLDMGFKVDGKFQPFVNEVEFVPSLYAEGSSATVRRVHFNNVNKYIKETAAQMVKITKAYAKTRSLKLKRPLFARRVATPQQRFGKRSPERSGCGRRSPVKH